MKIRDAIELQSGGPGSGRHVTLYHGTTLQRAQKIAKQGLKPGNRRVHNFSQRGMVYVTPSLSRAKTYAQRSLQSNNAHTAVVLQMKVPSEVHKKMKIDPEDKIGSKHYGGLMYQGKLSSKLITHAHYRSYSRGSWEKEELK